MLRSLGPCVSVESRGADMSIFRLQQYAALSPASGAWSKDGKHGLDLSAPPVSLALPVSSSTLVYEPSDPTRLSDYFSLPIWLALGSPCGVSELGNCNLMNLRMSA